MPVLPPVCGLCIDCRAWDDSFVAWLSVNHSHTHTHAPQGADRLLLIKESAACGSGASGLALQHLLVPHDYLAANYPIASTAVSADGA